MGLASKRKIKEYFDRFTTPFKREDEKRLRSELHDDRLCLRYNYISRTAQVWHNLPSSLYILFNIESPYYIGKAIYCIREGKRTARQLAEQFEKQVEDNKRDSDNKINELALETAKEFSKTARERTTMSIWEDNNGCLDTNKSKNRSANRNACKTLN